MPRLSNQGRVTAPGTGLGLVSVDGQVIHASGGDANWISDTEIVFQGCAASAARGRKDERATRQASRTRQATRTRARRDERQEVRSGCQILAYDVSTGHTRVLDPIGANWLRARDGGWAAWYNGQIRTSAGWVFPGSGYIGDVARGGILIAGPDLRGLTAYTLSGQSLAFLPTGVISDDATSGLNVRVRGALLLYQADAIWHLHTGQTGALAELPITPREEPVSYAVPLTIGGVPWILERTGRLSIRPHNSTLGYVVTEELCYSPDAVPYGDQIRVTWARTQGQAPADIGIRDLDLSAPRVDLGPAPAAAMPDVTEVVPPRRAFALGSYVFYNLADPLGDLVLGITASPDALEHWQRAGYRLIETTDSLAPTATPWGIYAGEWTEATCEEAIDQARPIADEKGTGVVAYQDSIGIRESVIAKLKTGDAIAPQAYINHGEEIGAFAARVRAEVERLQDMIEARGEQIEIMPAVNWHKRIDPAHPNGLPDSVMANAWIAMTDLADEQMWLGILGFRQGTSDFCTALVPYLEQFAQGITAVAELPTPDQPDPGPGPDPGPDPGPGPGPDPGPGPGPIPPPSGEPMPFPACVLDGAGKMMRVESDPNQSGYGTIAFDKTVNPEAPDKGAGRDERVTVDVAPDGAAGQFTIFVDGIKKFLSLRDDGSISLVDTAAGGDEKGYATTQPDGSRLYYVFHGERLEPVLRLLQVE